MKIKSGWWLGLVACLAVEGAAGRSAEAHPQFALSTVNRYGKVVLGGSGGVRLFYTLMVGDVPANTLRRQADHDGDGQLSAAEQQALGKTLVDQLQSASDRPDRPALTLELDGKPVSIRWEAPLLTLPDPRVGPLAFACELTATLDIPVVAGAGNERTIRYEDRAALPPIGEVELRIEEGPGARVLAAWQGTTPPKTESGSLIFQNYGPPRSSLSDRSITIRFVGEKAPPLLLRPRQPWRLIAGLLALLVVVAGIVGVRASRRAG